MKTTVLKTLILTLILTTGFINAQGKFYANSYVQVVGGSFSDGSNHTNVFLYGGIKYQAQNYYLSLNIPLVFGGSSSFLQIGDTYLRNNNDDESTRNWFNRNDHMGNNSSGMSSLNIGVGDLYLNGSYTFLNEYGVLPAVSVDGYFKIPTATESLGIGSGKYDYLTALGFSKTFSRLSLYAQIGYLTIGKVDSVNSNNPVTLSVGAGYIFGDGKNALFLAYDSYSTILPGYAAPRQVGLGYNYSFNKDLFFSLIVSMGLNNSTSDYTLSSGFNYGI